MANTYKVLGQSNPAAATLTEIYAVPAATQVIISLITVCNRSSVATSFRISIEINGAANSNEQYLAFDVPIGPNEMIPLKELGGITIDATDTINVFATLATLSFNVFGVEIT
jgi:hypothetical protein